MGKWPLKRLTRAEAADDSSGWQAPRSQIFVFAKVRRRSPIGFAVFPKHLESNRHRCEDLAAQTEHISGVSACQRFQRPSPEASCKLGASERSENDFSSRTQLREMRRSARGPFEVAFTHRTQDSEPRRERQARSSQRSENCLSSQSQRRAVRRSARALSRWHSRIAPTTASPDARGKLRAPRDQRTTSAMRISDE